MDESSGITPTPGSRGGVAREKNTSKVSQQSRLVPLRSGQGVALIAATVFASMAGFLDATVVNVAVPAIANDLGASLVALQWSLTGYLLTAASLLLIAGTFADRYGRRRVLVIGLLIMLMASIGCAVAPSFGVLIAARILQGVGAALGRPKQPGLAQRHATGAGSGAGHWHLGGACLAWRAADRTLCGRMAGRSCVMAGSFPPQRPADRGRCAGTRARAR